MTGQDFVDNADEELWSLDGVASRKVSLTRPWLWDPELLLAKVNQLPTPPIIVPVPRKQRRIEIGRRGNYRKL